MWLLNDEPFHRARPVRVRASSLLILSSAKTGLPTPMSCERCVSVQALGSELLAVLGWICLREFGGVARE
jgi:hypothetical protein